MERMYYIMQYVKYILLIRELLEHDPQDRLVMTITSVKLMLSQARQCGINVDKEYINFINTARCDLL